MTFCISFYGIFVSVDAHFACMDGVRLGFLSLLQFLEHWLVHNSVVSLFFFLLAPFDLSRHRVCTNIFGYSACTFETLAVLRYLHLVDCRCRYG